MKLDYEDFERLGCHPQSYGDEKLLTELVQRLGMTKAREYLEKKRKEAPREGE